MVQAPLGHRRSGYLHGYSTTEQQRLIDQALYLEPLVFNNIQFSQTQRVLEVGCGAGVQISILLRKWPELRITGVDRSHLHLSYAQRRLQTPLSAGRLELIEACGETLPLADDSFDGAFTCWLLEHVPNPQALLHELRRVISPGAVYYATEMFNATLFTEPNCPAITAFWQHFNRRQIELGGDPHAGSKLGGWLHTVGFRGKILPRARISSAIGVGSFGVLSLCWQERKALIQAC